MRKIQWLAVCVALAACDATTSLQPNTDIGLRVWAEVKPTQISIHDSLASLHVRVFARNPTFSTLRITSGGPPYHFTTDPTESRGLEQGFRIANAASPLNAGPSTDYWGQPVYVFAPLEAQMAVTEVTLRAWRQGGWPLTPGTYWVRSYFNGREGERAAFTLVP
jgi:hypothetical protein